MKDIPNFLYVMLVHSDKKPLQLKIGKGTDVIRRKNDHSSGDALQSGQRQVELLAAWRADADRESTLLNHFREFRIEGENFRVHEARPLTDWVRWMRHQAFVARLDDELPLIGEWKGLSYSDWCPNDFRVVAPEEDLYGVYEHEFPLPLRSPDDYYTPWSIWKHLKSFLWPVDLDPASDPVANQTIKAIRYHTRWDDGLSQPWRGKVWLNPPFSKYQLFAEKLLKSQHKCDEICCLHALGAMSAGYFQPLLEQCDAHLIISGRHAHTGLGDSKQPNTGHGLLYFGPRTNQFCKAVQPLGTTWIRHAEVTP